MNNPVWYYDTLSNVIPYSLIATGAPSGGHKARGVMVFSSLLARPIKQATNKRIQLRSLRSLRPSANGSANALACSKGDSAIQAP